MGERMVTMPEAPDVLGELYGSCGEHGRAARRAADNLEEAARMVVAWHLHGEAEVFWASDQTGVPYQPVAWVYASNVDGSGVDGLADVSGVWQSQDLHGVRRYVEEQVGWLREQLQGRV